MNKVKERSRKGIMQYREKLLNIGYGNMVVASKVVAILMPGSSPIKRLKESAREMNRLIDVTQGKKTRSLVITDSNHILLSAVQAETLAQRLNITKVQDMGRVSER